MDVKKGIMEKISEITELPKDFVMNMPRIVMYANKELEVTNYKSIVEYNDNIIRLSTNNKQIIVTGSELKIRMLEEDFINICGNIIKVEYSKKGYRPQIGDNIEQNQQKIEN